MKLSQAACLEPGKGHGDHGKSGPTERRLAGLGLLMVPQKI